MRGPARETVSAAPLRFRARCPGYRQRTALGSSGAGESGGAGVKPEEIDDLRDMGVRAAAGAGAGGAIGAVAGTALCLLLGVLGFPVRAYAARVIGGTAALAAGAAGVRASRGEDLPWKEIGDDLVRTLAGGK